MVEQTLRGALWGLVGAVLMAVVTAFAVSANATPMPEPVAVALARLITGVQSAPVSVALGLGLHLGFGTIAGAAFAIAVGGEDGGGLLAGLAFGVGLWLVLQVTALPLVGWGVFGTDVTVEIAVATLIQYLLYGGILGWGVARAGSPR